MGNTAYPTGLALDLAQYLDDPVFEEREESRWYIVREVVVPHTDGSRREIEIGMNAVEHRLEEFARRLADPVHAADAAAEVQALVEAAIKDAAS